MTGFDSRLEATPATLHFGGKMTYEKDRIDEAKKILKEHLENETIRKYFRNTIVPNDLLQWLIQEIEKLRRLVDTYDILEIDYLSRQIDSLQKDIKDLEGDVCLKQIVIDENRATYQEILKLKADNAELKNKYHKAFDELGNERFKHAHEIKHFKAQLSESQKKVKELERLAIKKQWENIKQ